jgi:hypothetical protein
MLAAPFTLNLEGPAAAKDVYDVFLKNYFDFKYPYGDPKDPLEIERKAALVTRMTEDTIEKLQKLRAEARRLLETRLKSSLCRPLEDGGDDCGGVSSSKAKRLRSALTRDQQRADHALLMFEKHVSNVLYRPCKGSILKYEKGLCSDEFDVEIKVTEGKGKSLISPFSEAVGRFRIEAGKPYIIEARGTYDCGDGVYVADAGNVSSGGGPFEDAPNSHPDKPRYCELTVNGGFIDWGPFKPDNIGHVYSTTLIAPAAQLDFQLYDESLDFNNNSGSLQVKVCQALTAAS